MNYPQQQVPGLLKELMRGRDEDDALELMDSFGSMRVPWLEVHCADGLQVIVAPASSSLPRECFLGCRNFLRLVRTELCIEDRVFCASVIAMHVAICWQLKHRADVM